MGILDSITLDQKVKAFERTRNEANIPNGKLALVTEEYYDAALKLLREFRTDEPICSSLQVQMTPEWDEIWMSALRHHMSLMIINETTGEPMALRVIKLTKVDDRVYPSTVADTDLKKIFAFFNHCEERVKLFERIGETEAFHFYGLCVAKQYRNRGLGWVVFEACINMVKHFRLKSLCIRGEASSNFSKKIYEKAGFETLFEIKYSEYIIDGEQVFNNTGEHKSFTIHALKIKQ